MMNIFTANRIGRLVFFGWMLPIWVISGFITAYLRSESHGDEASAVLWMTGIIIAAFAAFPIVKRLHDLNQSGWLCLLGLVPVINVFLGIYLLFGKGTDGVNDYGSAPENLFQTLVAGSSFNTQSGDNTFYQQAYEEVEKGEMDKGLWARLFAQSGGDEKKTKARYIQIRSEELLQKDSEQTERLKQEECERADLLLRESVLSKRLKDCLSDTRYEDALRIAKQLATLNPQDLFVQEQLQTLPDLARCEQADRQMAGFKENPDIFFSVRVWDKRVDDFFAAFQSDFNLNETETQKYRVEVDALRAAGIVCVRHNRRVAVVILTLVAILITGLVVADRIKLKAKIHEFQQAVEAKNLSRAEELATGLGSRYETANDLDALVKNEIALRKQPIEGQRWIADLGSGVLMSFMSIPAGSFMPTSDGRYMLGSGGVWELKSAHQVTLSKPFWMAKTEVTQAQYQQVMGSNPSAFKGAKNPVETVSWNDAMEFCRRLTTLERQAEHLPEGREYTLPTEAQWEYACRAGTSGDYAGYLDSMAWYIMNSGGETHPVGTKQPNAWGLYDMHGNVGEWCADWYNDPFNESSRVYRGGSWTHPALGCTSACSHGQSPSLPCNSTGFRPVLSAVIVK